MNDSFVSIRAWRLAITLLILSIVIPALSAMIISGQAQTIVWSGFDDRWSITSGSITNDQWQVQIISNSIGLAVHPARTAPSSGASVDQSAFSFQARITTIDPQAAAGVVINAQDQNNFMAFLISGDGYMSLRERRSGVWIDRAPWREWPHVKRNGQSNILRVECALSKCTFFVNDEVTLQENNLSAGRSIGLIAYPITFVVPSTTVIFDQIMAFDQQNR